MAVKKVTGKTKEQEPKTETALQKYTEPLLERVENFTVTSNEDCIAGEELRKGIAKARKFVDAILGESKKTAYKAYKDIADRFKAFDDPLKEGYDALGRKIGAYVREQRRLEEEAKEKERRRTQMLELQKAQEALAAKAAVLIAANREDEAQKLMEAELEVKPVRNSAIQFTSSLPKVDGRTIREEPFRAHVVDLMALVKGVAEGKVPLLAIQANQSWLNAQAKLCMDTDALNFPGVEVRRGE